MRNHQPLIAEYRHASDRVHALGMQEMRKLGQVVNSDMVRTRKRMIERDINASVAIFYIENYRIPA